MTLSLSNLLNGFQCIGYKFDIPTYVTEDSECFITDLEIDPSVVPHTRHLRLYRITVVLSFGGYVPVPHENLLTPTSPSMSPSMRRKKDRHPNPMGFEVRQG